MKMPVLGHVLRDALLEKIPYRSSAEQNAPESDSDNPHIEEAGREVPSKFTDRTPTLFVTA
jgi:hypothetical protein